VTVEREQTAAGHGGTSLWRGSAAAGAGLLVVQVAGLLSMRTVARALGPQDYGHYGLALVFSIYAYQLVQWGLDPLLTRMLTQAGPAQARRHLAAFVRQKQLAGAAVLALGVVAAALSSASDGRVLIYLGILDGVALGMSAPCAFDARGRTPLYFWLAAVRQCCFLAAVLSLVTFAAGWVSTATVLILHVACILIQIALEWTWVRREYGALEWSGAGTGARELWGAALPMAIAAGSLQVLNAIGPPALKFTGIEDELGYLVLSNQLMVAMMAFLTIPSRMVHARLAALSPAEPSFRRRVWLTTAIFTAIGVLIAVAVSASSYWIVLLLIGKQYVSAAPLLAVDAWRAVGIMAGAVLGSALICQHRKRAYAACYFLALAAAVALALTLIPRYGAVGAVAAVAVGRMAFAVFAGMVLLSSSAADGGETERPVEAEA
jgi:O-antigen/teichoic acid export membrane protein